MLGQNARKAKVFGALTRGDAALRAHRFYKMCASHVGIPLISAGRLPIAREEHQHYASHHEELSFPASIGVLYPLSFEFRDSAFTFSCVRTFTVGPYLSYPPP